MLEDESQPLPRSRVGLLFQRAARTTCPTTTNPEVTQARAIPPPTFALAVGDRMSPTQRSYFSPVAFLSNTPLITRLGSRASLSINTRASATMGRIMAVISSTLSAALFSRW